MGEHKIASFANSPHLCASSHETSMPTVTTTVTSACASGAVTTQTTTEATPDAGGASSVAQTTVEAMVASWGAGKLKETQSQFFSPTVQALDHTLWTLCRTGSTISSSTNFQT